MGRTRRKIIRDNSDTSPLLFMMMIMDDDDEEGEGAVYGLRLGHTMDCQPTPTSSCRQPALRRKKKKS